jgi:hypothetical protein
MKYSRSSRIFQAIGFSFNFICARKFLPIAADKNDATKRRANSRVAVSTAVYREIFAKWISCGRNPLEKTAQKRVQFLKHGLVSNIIPLI